MSIDMLGMCRDRGRVCKKPLPSFACGEENWGGWLLFTGGPVGSSDSSPWCPQRMKSSLATLRPPTKASLSYWTPPEMGT